MAVGVVPLAAELAGASVDPPPGRPGQHLVPHARKGRDRAGREAEHGHRDVLDALVSGVVRGRRGNRCHLAEAEPQDVEVVDRMLEAWGGGEWIKPNGPQPHEARLLRLDCSKARAELGWRPRLRLEGALDKVVEWHKNVASGGELGSGGNGAVGGSTTTPLRVVSPRAVTTPASSCGSGSRSAGSVSTVRASASPPTSTDRISAIASRSC